MHPLDVDPFVVPGTLSLLVFVALVFGIIAWVVLGVWWAADADEPTERTVAWLKGTSFGAVVWLVLTAAPSLTGVLHWRTPVPMVVVLVATSLLCAVALAWSRLGARLAALPTVALVGFQAFRLPLEVVLHTWYGQGSLPVQMTWEGQNLDVITGTAALVLVLVGLVRPLPRVVVWAFELLGLGLLLNVMRIALPSAPTPMRTWWNEPALLLPFHWPTTWIVTVCVAGALFGHLVLLRHLLAGPRDLR